MTTSIELQPRAINVVVTDDFLTITLVDGRTLSIPTTWFPRLAQATPEQRAGWRLMGAGTGIRWEPVDEDISVPRLLGLPTD
ncbi:MAG: DUF2442 domain-containing protein [Ktedonobacterales bacterium]